MSGSDPEAGRDEKSGGGFKIISILALIALILVTGLIILALFSPGLPYRIAKGPPEDLSSEHFARSLEALTGAQLYRSSTFQVLTNGERFYEAELAAIKTAQKSVDLEAYIFQKGEIGSRFIDALAERAKAGVTVNVLADAIGSFRLQKSEFKALIDAGGQIEWYHPIRLTTWPRVNNRTHRELLIIDGTVGFIGGAGVADHWYEEHDGAPRWRDTMVRVEGLAVTGLQAVFAQNWLESSGEIITGKNFLPFKPVPAPSDAMSLVVGSSPTA